MIKNNSGYNFIYHLDINKENEIKNIIDKNNNNFFK